MLRRAKVEVGAVGIGPRPYRSGANGGVLPGSLVSPLGERALTRHSRAAREALGRGFPLLEDVQVAVARGVERPHGDHGRWAQAEDLGRGGPRLLLGPIPGAPP